jgi:cobalt-zinc-cadmium efflux system membrane fusion protein
MKISSRIAFLLQFFGSLAIVGLAVGYFLFFQGAEPQNAGQRQPSSLNRAVEVIDGQRIRVLPETRLGQQLIPGVVRRDEISTPLLRVTGTVAASLRPVGPDTGDQWQFNEPEALTAFFDWRRASIDAQFFEEQIARMVQLDQARMRSQQQIVDRLRRTVDTGTASLADLQVAEAEFLQTQIEGRQGIHEAESDFRRAQQELAVAARQLQLMGLDIDMLQQATADVDVVVAEVPEDYLARVRIGQECQARFFGFPREIFPGVVQRVSPTLSIERRALRVLFFVDDPDDKLRPGMFADIGLGTEARQATLIPAESVIHIGKEDFVFVRDSSQPDTWLLAEVEVGDARGGIIEVLSGLNPGTEIIAAGAILLKPIAASIVREAARSQR